MEPAEAAESEVLPVLQGLVANLRRTAVIPMSWDSCSVYPEEVEILLAEDLGLRIRPQAVHHRHRHWTPNLPEASAYGQEKCFHRHLVGSLLAEMSEPAAAGLAHVAAVAPRRPSGGG